MAGGKIKAAPANSRLRPTAAVAMPAAVPGQSPKDENFQK
jgi:hypothetical protein